MAVITAVVQWPQIVRTAWQMFTLAELAIVRLIIPYCDVTAAQYREIILENSCLYPSRSAVISHVEKQHTAAAYCGAMPFILYAPWSFAPHLVFAIHILYSSYRY